MALYETMVVLRPELEAEERESLLQGMKDVITKLQGEICKVDDWGLRRLAYEIKKINEGYYYLLYFNGSSETITELEHYFRVNDTFIRYMICAADQDAFDAAVAAEQKAKEAAEKRAKEAAEKAAAAEASAAEATAAAEKPAVAEAAPVQEPAASEDQDADTTPATE